MTNRGDVLLRADQGDPRAATGFVVSDGSLLRLPNAPGAEFTSYEGLNDAGWRVGRARFDHEDPRERMRWLGFVVQPVW